jgi:penicillin-binding protein 1A
LREKEKKAQLCFEHIFDGESNWFFVAIIVFVAAGFGSVIGVAEAYLETTPELDTGKIEEPDLTSYIYDQQGNLLATYSGPENRDWASIDEIPKDLQNAVIAVEDIRFWTHDGIDIRRLAGAFVSNLSSSKVEGGSTITQQLIKNKLLSNEKSYKRKLQEAFLATELERKYTKDEILEAYLNSIPLGGRVYGVKTAAKDYFGKEMSQLTLKEMVCIAAITQSTTKFNPRRATYTNPDDLPYLINRMNIITERMLWNSMITEEQYEETYIPAEEYLSDESVLDDEDGGRELILAPGYLEKWKAEMKILEESPANTIYKYPHFVEYVIKDVQDFMLEKQGLEDTSENRLAVDREMRAGGYKIYATIDTKIQDTVQTTLEEWDQYPDFKKQSDSVTIERTATETPWR